MPYLYLPGIDPEQERSYYGSDGGGDTSNVDLSSSSNADGVLQDDTEAGSVSEQVENTAESGSGAENQCIVSDGGGDESYRDENEKANANADENTDASGGRCGA